METPDPVAHRNLKGGSAMQIHLNTDSPEQLNRTCDNCGKSFKTRRSYIIKAIVRGCNPPRFCSRACYSAQKPAPKTWFNITPPDVRFWINVEKTEGCWLWRGSVLQRSGYGRIMVGGKTIIASRYSYMLHHGTISDDVFVLHTCDNRICVRPDHLFLGTQADNMADCKRKGRNVFGIRQHSAKLTEAKVIEIRQRYATGSISQEKLAREYGVSQPLVGCIVRREMWKHV